MISWLDGVPHGNETIVGREDQLDSLWAGTCWKRNNTAACRLELRPHTVKRPLAVIDEHEELRVAGPSCAAWMPAFGLDIWSRVSSTDIGGWEETDIVADGSEDCKRSQVCFVCRYFYLFDE